LDTNKIYFRHGNKTIVKATISNRFYLVFYIESNSKKEIIFDTTDINIKDINKIEKYPYTQNTLIPKTPLYQK
jgi:hypothetical protein